MGALGEEPAKVKKQRHVLSLFSASTARPLDTNRESKSINKAFQSSALLNEPTQKATLDDMQGFLSPREHKMLHLGMHGGVGAESTLGFPCDNGQVMGVDLLVDAVTAYCSLLRDKQDNGTPGVECVVINACKSAGIGGGLSKAGVKCVVCWETNVADEAAIIFTEAFYHSIAQENSQKMPWMEKYRVAFDVAVSKLNAVLWRQIDTGDLDAVVQKNNEEGRVDLRASGIAKLFVCELKPQGEHFERQVIEKMEQLEEQGKQRHDAAINAIAAAQTKVPSAFVMLPFEFVPNDSQNEAWLTKVCKDGEVFYFRSGDTESPERCDTIHVYLIDEFTGNPVQNKDGSYQHGGTAQKPMYPIKLEKQSARFKELLPAMKVGLRALNFIADNVKELGKGVPFVGIAGKAVKAMAAKAEKAVGGAEQQHMQHASASAAYGDKLGELQRTSGHSQQEFEKFIRSHDSDGQFCEMTPVLCSDGNQRYTIDSHREKLKEKYALSCTN